LSDVLAGQAYAAEGHPPGRLHHLANASKRRAVPAIYILLRTRGLPLDSTSRWGFLLMFSNNHSPTLHPFPPKSTPSIVKLKTWDRWQSDR